MALVKHYLFECFRKQCDTLNCGFWWTWQSTWAIRTKLKSALKSVPSLLLFSFPILSISVFSVYNSKMYLLWFFSFQSKIFGLSEGFQVFCFSKLPTKDLTRNNWWSSCNSGQFSKLIQLLPSGNKPMLELTCICKWYAKVAVFFFLIVIRKISLGCRLRFSLEWVLVVLQHVTWQGVCKREFLKKELIKQLNGDSFDIHQNLI